VWWSCCCHRYLVLVLQRLCSLFLQLTSRLPAGAYHRSHASGSSAAGLGGRDSQGSRHASGASLPDADVPVVHCRARLMEAVQWLTIALRPFAVLSTAQFKSQFEASVDTILSECKPASAAHRAPTTGPIAVGAVPAPVVMASAADAAINPVSAALSASVSGTQLAGRSAPGTVSQTVRSTQGPAMPGAVAGQVIGSVPPVHMDAAAPAGVNLHVDQAARMGKLVVFISRDLTCLTAHDL